MCQARVAINLGAPYTFLFPFLFIFLTCGQFILLRLARLSQASQSAIRTHFSPGSSLVVVVVVVVALYNAIARSIGRWT